MGRGDQASSATRPSVRQAEQIAILALAILLGLVGLAVHVVWLGSIVLMSVLLGLIAADVRGRRGRGVISVLVAEAKNVAEDVTSGGSLEEDGSEPRSAASTRRPAG